MTDENFRQELERVFDDMAGSPSPALRDRVRSLVTQAPEKSPPLWIAGVAAAALAALMIGVLFVANPLSRPTNNHGPVAGSSPTSSAPQSPAPSPSAQPTPSGQPFVCASPTAFNGPNPSLPGYIDAVRTGSHPGYDRLTIEFQDGQPLSIQLQPQSNAAFTRDGIGDTVTLAGNNGVLVTIFSGDVHTAYSGPTDIKTGYADLLEVRVVGDYEGYVHFGLGLAQPACYRASILTNPTRLVIDFQTP